jgi:hypothetical protein
MTPLFFIERISFLIKDLGFPGHQIFIVLPIFLINFEVFIVLFHARRDPLPIVDLIDLARVILQVLLQVAR